MHQRPRLLRLAQVLRVAGARRDRLGDQRVQLVEARVHRAELLVVQPGEVLHLDPEGLHRDLELDQRLLGRPHGPLQPLRRPAPPPADSRLLGPASLLGSASGCAARTAPASAPCRFGLGLRPRRLRCRSRGSASDTVPPRLLLRFPVRHPLSLRADGPRAWPHTPELGRYPPAPAPPPPVPRGPPPYGPRTPPRSRPSPRPAPRSCRSTRRCSRGSALCACARASSAPVIRP